MASWYVAHVFYYYHHHHHHHHHIIITQYLLYSGLVYSENKLSHLDLILFLVLFLFASYVPYTFPFIICVHILCCCCYGLFSCWLSTLIKLNQLYYYYYYYYYYHHHHYWVLSPLSALSAYLFWCRCCAIVLCLCIWKFMYLWWFYNWPWASNIARQ